MSSSQDIADALTSFYKLMVSNPCLGSFASVATPPATTGWSSISNPTGKDDKAIRLLRHLPYLHRRDKSSSSQLAIYPGTIPVSYATDNEAEAGWRRERAYPLPPHCVYLAVHEDYLGTDLILDADKGTVTEFAMGNYSVSFEEYEALPQAERWRAHTTATVGDFTERWNRMYTEFKWLIAPNPIAQPVVVRFYDRPSHTADEDAVVDGDYEGGTELDREQRDVARREREHAESIYEVYSRYGWPVATLSETDADKLKNELMGLERAKDAEQRRRMDEMNPDAALFDSD
ncbi:hypothetical protein GGR57DRAFT_504651 [Xylariaceae sp. FL1272]|nr:hypothetical protein GGR57DRAFT_504651 [Xylariaceae sp. FL1272]